MRTLPSVTTRSSVPVVELAGPAGAGKSTVRRLVRATFGDAGTVTAEHERTHARTAALALRQASEWLPLVAVLLRRSPHLAGELLRHVVRVRTLAAELPRMQAAAPVALLLDEGPVLSLALLSRACELAPTPALERYVEAALTVWGEALDMVVFLDAPDPVLARRINDRTKPHRVKGRSEAEVRAFLAWYRLHYAWVLRELTARGVRVVRMDTGDVAAEMIALRVAALVRAVTHAR